MPDKKPPLQKLKMVDWYNPRLLIATALDTALSTLFGKYSDYRVVEAFGAHAKTVFDYSDRAELWLDYASDVGDGWNSTYAVAHALAQPELEVAPGVQTARGNLLVLGGDQVYPLASRQNYYDRFVTPYEQALPAQAGDGPHLFAIPGNHDWYDGLVSFSRLFCTRRQIGGWQTRQACSYFAIKLPHGWWLVGTDVQLGADLDSFQLDYFRDVAATMEPSDRIIMCNAEPYWVTENKYKKYTPDYLRNNLEFLQESIFGGRVRIFIAGDLHHYRRFEHVPLGADGSPQADEKIEMITAGGGGAFLHPTHDISFSEIENEGRRLSLQSEYPDRATSRRLTYGNILFFWKNFSFGWIPALVYLFAAWSFASESGGAAAELQLSARLADTVQQILYAPLSAFWIVFVMAGTFLYASLSHVKAFRWAAGLTHGAVNVLAIFMFGWLIVWLTTEPLGMDYGTPGQLVLSGLLMFAIGWLFGSLLLGMYLLFSLNVLGRHSNEAFSSLKIEDWKHFLRIHIDEGGDLTIYPVGIERVPRHWREVESAHGAQVSRIEPVAVRPEQRPQLIEAPIVVRRHPTA
jgi:hypothetical protein